MKRLIAALTLAIVGGAAPVAAQTTIAVDITKATLAWTWTQGTGGAVEEFRVKCGPSSGTHTTTHLAPPAARSVPVLTVVPAPGVYFCVVTAANQFGESAPTNEVAFNAGTVPLAPTNLEIRAQ